MKKENWTDTKIGQTPPLAIVYRNLQNKSRLIVDPPFQTSCTKFTKKGRHSQSVEAISISLSIDGIHSYVKGFSRCGADEILHKYAFIDHTSSTKLLGKHYGSVVKEVKKCEGLWRLACGFVFYWSCWYWGSRPCCDLLVLYQNAIWWGFYQDPPKVIIIT